MGLFVQGDRTGNTDRFSALPSVNEWHYLAIGHKHIRSRSRRSNFSTIMKRQRSAAAFEHKQKAATADPRTLRLNKPQHKVRSNGRINRMPAL